MIGIALCMASWMLVSAGMKRLHLAEKIANPTDGDGKAEIARLPGDDALASGLERSGRALVSVGLAAAAVAGVAILF